MIPITNLRRSIMKQSQHLYCLIPPSASHRRKKHWFETTWNGTCVSHLARAGAGNEGPRCVSWSAERWQAPRSRWRPGSRGRTPPVSGWAEPARNTPPGSDRSSYSPRDGTPRASGDPEASAGSPEHKHTRVRDQKQHRRWFPSRTFRYLLNLRQDLQWADGVIRVGRDVLAAAASHLQRPLGHRVQNRLVQWLGDERMRKLTEIVLQHACRETNTLLLWSCTVLQIFLIALLCLCCCLSNSVKR